MDDREGVFTVTARIYQYLVRACCNIPPQWPHLAPTGSHVLPSIKPAELWSSLRKHRGRADELRNLWGQDWGLIRRVADKRKTHRNNHFSSGSISPLQQALKPGMLHSDFLIRKACGTVNVQWPEMEKIRSSYILCLNLKCIFWMHVQRFSMKSN